MVEALAGAYQEELDKILADDDTAPEDFDREEWQRQQEQASEAVLARFDEIERETVGEV